MTVKKWTLTDVTAGIHVEDLTISPRDLGGRLPGLEIRKTTLRGGLCDGVEVVRVNNGRMSFAVLPTRGMGLWKAWLDGEEIGWQSPVRGPVHPKFVPLMEPGGLGWLDGFDELLVRCGLESNGAPDFDDRKAACGIRCTAGSPIGPRTGSKSRWTTRSGEIAVTGVVEETRFLFRSLRMTSRISTRLGENHLRIRDEVENLSGSPTEVQLLYHINFGQPLLDAGSRFVAAVKKMMPRERAGRRGGRDVGRLRPGVGRVCRAGVLHGAVARRSRLVAHVAKERGRHAGRQRPREHEAVALLHAVEEHRRGGGRLRHRAGAGHELPQSADV